MKKQFENIDDFTQFKINSLGDEDVELNDKLIWAKVEKQLDRKPKVIIFWQQRVAAVACIVSLIGGSFLVLTKNKINEVSNLKISEPIVVKVPLVEKIEVKRIAKRTDNQQVIYIKIVKKEVNQERLELNIGQIATPQTIIITNPTATFKPIEIPQILTQIPQKKTPKMRVMHLNNYQDEPFEVYTKPKTFFVQADIQSIIKSQTQIMPYAPITIPN